MEQSKNSPKITNWQIIMLFFSIYVLIAMAVDTIFKIDKRTSELLRIFDNLICGVFIFDFFLSLITSKNKLSYLKWGWIDLISSIPTIQIFRWGRLVRVFRVLRILRGVRSTKKILTLLFENKAKGTFSAFAMISFILMIFSSIAVLNAEVSPTSNIQNAKDAIWWSFVTITTVGYGDFYPVTTLGRIVAALILTAGVGLFEPLQHLLLHNSLLLKIQTRLRKNTKSF